MRAHGQCCLCYSLLPFFGIEVEVGCRGGGAEGPAFPLWGGHLRGSLFRLQQQITFLFFCLLVCYGPLAHAVSLVFLGSLALQRHTSG